MCSSNLGHCGQFCGLVMGQLLPDGSVMWKWLLYDLERGEELCCCLE